MAARRLEMARATAEAAVRSIGLGYDVAADVRLKYCKQRAAPDPSLIELDRDGVQDIVLPGNMTVAGVPKSIKCDKGERMRFRSDVLSFQQVCFLVCLCACVVKTTKNNARCHVNVWFQWAAHATSYILIQYKVGAPSKKKGGRSIFIARATSFSEQEREK